MNNSHLTLCHNIHCFSVHIIISSSLKFTFYVPFALCSVLIVIHVFPCALLDLVRSCRLHTTSLYFFLSIFFFLNSRCCRQVLVFLSFVYFALEQSDSLFFGRLLLSLFSPIINSLGVVSRLFFSFVGVTMAACFSALPFSSCRG